MATTNADIAASSLDGSSSDGKNNSNNNSNNSNTLNAADGKNSNMRQRKRSVVEVLGGPNDGQSRTLDLEHLNDADAALAAQFGYKPVFKREFGYLSTFSFAVSISGLFATTMTTFIYPLEAGGPASAVWCWLISGAGCMCIACSVAELVSAYPTCGGLYYTVSRLAPRDWVPAISWLDGWLNLLGQIAGVASSEYGAAQMLLAAVCIGSDFTYEITTETTIGVMAGLTVLTGIVNSLSTYWMEKLTKGYVIFHVLVLVSCSIALLAKTDNKNSGEYVFTHIEGDSGWHPIGFAFLFGFLSVSWTMTDYDATAHITEEISEPEIKAPWAISLAMAFTYVAGWLFNIVLTFCMGNPYGDYDPADPTAPRPIFKTVTGQIVVQLFYNSLGKGGAIFFTICGFIIIKFVCFTSMQALGRTIFAFSRDRMLPYSNIWVKIDHRTGTPLLAVWIAVFWCIVINLIGLGSYAAIAGVFNVCAIALDWSYCIPILCKLIFGKFEPGPWNMGRASVFVNAWACIWTLFVSIIFILPTIRPVTATNMNYAAAFLGLILICSAIFWYVSGKNCYTGPVIEAQSEDATGSQDGSSLDEHHRKEKAGDEKMATEV